MKEFLILFSWALLVSSMMVKAGQIEVTPENYVQAKGTPYDNPDYAYTLLIPKGFKSEKLTSKSSELSTTKLTPLGSFYSYIDSETEKLLINIRISGILSNGVVDPAGVFNRVLTKQGDVDLINVEPVDASSAVGYMTRKIEGNDYVEYSKVNVYGTQIFILQCFLPKSSESEYVDKVCKVALDTFRMVNHKKSEANKTSSLQYFKFAGETLSLPDKWQKPTSNNPKGEDSYLDYMLYNRDNTIALGWVRIRYYTKNTFLEYLDSPDELPILIEETVKDEINSIGYRITGTVTPNSASHLNLNHRFPSATNIFSVYKAQDDNLNISSQCYLAIVDKGEIIYAISLMTPLPKSQNDNIWSFNTESFVGLIDSIYTG